MKAEIKLKRIGLAAQKFRGKTSGQKLMWSEEFRAKVLALIADGVGITKLSRATGIDRHPCGMANRNQNQQGPVLRSSKWLTVQSPLASQEVL